MPKKPKEHGKFPYLRVNRQFLVELLYPVLFAAALPLLNFASPSNVTLYIGEMLYMLVLYILSAVVVYGVVSIFLRHPGERLLAAIPLIHIFLEDFAGRINGMAPIVNIFFPSPTPHNILASAALIAVLFWVAVKLAPVVLRFGKRIISAEQAYLVLRVIAVFTFVINLFTFALFVYERWPTYSYTHNAPMESKLTANPKRDIYYIVFDRYASDSVLREQYKYDNSGFTGRLRENGLYVRDNAVSNYPFTAPSIASTLNMGYFNQISEQLGGQKRDSYVPYRKVIDEPLLYKYLTSAGYTAHSFGSWWGVTRDQRSSVSVNPHFEMHALGRKFVLNHFESSLLSKGAAWQFMKAGIGLPGVPLVKAAPTDDHRSVILSQFDMIEEFSKHSDGEHPRFLFAHIISPHPEYVFNENGNLPAYDGNDNDVGLPREDKYLNQLKYMNKKIINVIQEIKENSKTEPIIVLQADEGPWPMDFLADSNLKWQDADEELLKEKFGILAAYNLPGVQVTDENKRYINSVNIFRFVLNNYFGADLTNLPDCSFAFNNGEQYRFYDVTRVFHERDESCSNFHKHKTR